MICVIIIHRIYNANGNSSIRPWHMDDISWVCYTLLLCIVFMNIGRKKTLNQLLDTLFNIYSILMIRTSVDEFISACACI